MTQPSKLAPWAQPFVVSTARLQLAPCDAASALQLASIVTDVRVYEPFYGGRPQSTWREDSSAHWLQSQHDWERRHTFNLVASLHQTGEVVGCVQLFPHQIAYFVAPQFWRQGLGCEMVATCCEKIPPMLGIAVLETMVIRENLASRRVLEHSGFTFSGLTSMDWTGRAGTVSMLKYRRNTA
jgi:RimJ/RimL family protein N-acetyltransferase